MGIEEKPILSPRDQVALREAVRRLEYCSLVIEISNMLGSKVEWVVLKLPVRARKIVDRSVYKALKFALWLALRTLWRGNGQPWKWTHKGLCVVTGAVGGFFGAETLPVELPVTTFVMLRSIAEFARSEGEDLTKTEPQLSCLTVFALGGGRSKGQKTREENAETGYYAVRASLDEAIRDYVTAQISTRETAGSSMVRLIAKIAARFGIEVSDKVAAELVPVVGAAGGAAVNLAFINHFQRIAQGHFTIRRLERAYGEELIHREYEEALKNMETQLPQEQPSI